MARTLKLTAQVIRDDDGFVLVEGTVKQTLHHGTGIADQMQNAERVAGPLVSDAILRASQKTTQQIVGANVKADPPQPTPLLTAVRRLKQTVGGGYDSTIITRAQAEALLAELEGKK